MIHRVCFVSLLAAVTVLLPACPVETIVGKWAYFGCSGAPLGSIRFAADGVVHINLVGVSGTDPNLNRVARVDGEGTWSETNGQLQCSSDVLYTVTETNPSTKEETIITSTNGLYLFIGSVLNTKRIEGQASSDVPFGEVCVVFLR